MGKRLSKIYTRTGDKGETGLGDGSRTNKDNSRIQAIGSVDELNSWIGLLVEQLSILNSQPSHRRLGSCVGANTGFLIWEVRYLSPAII